MRSLLMVNPKRSLLALFSAMLLNMSLLGCAQRIVINEDAGFAKGDNCLFCHSSSENRGVRDFRPIYQNPKLHHPVGVAYPLGYDSRPDFFQPDGYDGKTIFFDTEGDGVLDEDDVRLFGTGNAVTVECASCHREHGDISDRRPVAGDYYLRITYKGSQLCITCHNK